MSVPYSDYALLLESCGLSRKDACALLKISIHQSRNYESGRSETPERIINLLAKAFIDVERDAMLGRGAKGITARGVARRSLEKKIIKNSSERGLI